MEHHNAVAKKKWPTEILDDVDENLCHWLCVFVSEIWKDNGKEYTPKSITQILSGLQRFIDSKCQPDNPVKLCDPSSHQFRALRSVLDWLFWELHRSFNFIYIHSWNIKVALLQRYKLLYIYIINIYTIKINCYFNMFVNSNQ